VVIPVPNWRQNWSWHGLAGVILAATVGIGWSVSLIITAFKDGPITPEGATILNTIGGGLIGAVATWIGLAGGKKPNDPDINQRTTSTTTETISETPHDVPGHDGAERKETV
jgi:hypothetical protein